MYDESLALSRWEAALAKTQACASETKNLFGKERMLAYWRCRAKK